MNVTHRIDRLKWAAIGVALRVGPMVAPQCTELHQRPGRILKVLRTFPLRSLLMISMRLPSLFAAN